MRTQQSRVVLLWGVVSVFGMLPEFLHSVVNAEEPNHNNYVDWSLPRSVSVAPFEGERYEAEIPDTVDLVDHANYALNMATRLWVPEWGYEFFNGFRLTKNPPILELGSGGLVSEGPKILEAIPMLRVMTGSDFNRDMDAQAIMGLVRITAKDGLCYYPVENRPWAFFDDYTKTVRQPYSDIWGEGRQLLTYACWYQHDKNPLWKELAEKKVRRLLEMTLKKENTLYFRLSRGYTPWDDPKEGPTVPIGDTEVYAAEKGMVGTPATYIVGWIPQAGAIWYRLTQEKSFLELSRGLAQYLFLYGEMLNPDTGEILADHGTHVSHSLLSNLSWALTFEDKPMVTWVKKGYEYHLHKIDPNRTGIVFSKEACLIADTIGIGIMLSQAGVGDYWEEVDHLIRNSFLDIQVTNPDWIKKQPFAIEKNLKPGAYQPEDGADRCIGIWRDNLDRWDWAQSCCNGNCSRMLYYVWDNILTHEGDQLRVNLLMNRASLWADMDSWLPYEGRVRIKIKTAMRKVLVRIPQWVDRDRVVCTINDKRKENLWSDDYIEAGSVNAGDQIVLEFPVQQRTIKSRFLVKIKADEDVMRETDECTVTLKGSTVIDVTPNPGYPIQQHEKYKADKAPMRKVTRFVSKERFLF